MNWNSPVRTPDDASDRRCADCDVPVGPNDTLCYACRAENNENDLASGELRCSECDGPLARLGLLGHLLHVRCRDCGAQASIEVR